MKKGILNVSLLCLLLGAVFILAAPTQASAAAVKKTSAKTVVKPSSAAAVKKTSAKTVVKPSSVTWAASGLRAIARIPAGVKPAYKKKVENYARRNHIKVITGTVVTSMRE